MQNGIFFSTEEKSKKKTEMINPGRIESAKKGQSPENERDENYINKKKREFHPFEMKKHLNENETELQFNLVSWINVYTFTLH